MWKKLSILMLMVLISMQFALPAAAEEQAGAGEEAQTDREQNAFPAMDMSLQELAEQSESSLAGEQDVPAIESEPWIPEDEANRAIFGSDDRVTVSNSYDYPFCAIAYMEYHYPCCGYHSGTGFMVGERGLITAAHCLICSDHHQPADLVTFYFGYQSSKNYSYCYNGPFRYWYGTDFSDPDSNNSNWDFGYVLFDEPVGQYMGWFGISAESDRELNDSSYYYCAGYRDGVLKYDYDKIEVRNDYLISHWIDTLPGTSGGPIFTSDYHVVAINVAHNDKYNIGRRITDSLLQSMKNEGIIG